MFLTTLLLIRALPVNFSYTNLPLVVITPVALQSLVPINILVNTSISPPVLLVISAPGVTTTLPFMDVKILPALITRLPCVFLVIVSSSLMPPSPGVPPCNTSKLC